MGCKGDWGWHRLVLPWPPSINHYWRHVMIGKAIRTLISAEGREYKNAVAAACMEQNAPRGLKNRIAVSIQLSPPDRRRRDIDNSLKALLDSLTYAHVWDDDSQIDDIRIYRASCVQNGQAVVDISEIHQEGTNDD